VAFLPALAAGSALIFSSNAAALLAACQINTGAYLPEKIAPETSQYK